MSPSITTSRRRGLKEGQKSRGVRTKHARALKKKEGTMKAPKLVPEDPDEKKERYDQYGPEEYRNLEMLPQCAATIIASTSPDEVVSALKVVRWLLSKAVVAAPYEVCETPGLLSALVRQVGVGEQAAKYEAMWVLTNLASGEQQFTRLVVDAGLVPLCIDALRTCDAHNKILVQALWILANVLGDSAEYRDFVLGQGFIAAAMDFVLSPKCSVAPLGLFAKLVWAISNVFRHSPKVPSAQLSPLLDFLKYAAASPRCSEIQVDISLAVSFFLEEDLSPEKMQMVYERDLVESLIEFCATNSDPPRQLVRATVKSICCLLEEDGDRWSRFLWSSRVMECMYSWLMVPSTTTRRGVVRILGFMATYEKHCDDMAVSDMLYDQCLGDLVHFVDHGYNRPLSLECVSTLNILVTRQRTYLITAVNRELGTALCSFLRGSIHGDVEAVMEGMELLAKVTEASMRIPELVDVSVMQSKMAGDFISKGGVEVLEEIMASGAFPEDVNEAVLELLAILLIDNSAVPQDAEMGEDAEMPMGTADALDFDEIDF